MHRRAGGGLYPELAAVKKVPAMGSRFCKKGTVVSLFSLDFSMKRGKRETDVPDVPRDSRNSTHVRMRTRTHRGFPKTAEQWQHFVVLAGQHGFRWFSPCHNRRYLSPTCMALICPFISTFTGCEQSSQQNGNWQHAAVHRRKAASRRASGDEESPGERNAPRGTVVARAGTMAKRRSLGASARWRRGPFLIHHGGRGERADYAAPV